MKFTEEQIKLLEELENAKDELFSYRISATLLIVSNVVPDSVSNLFADDIEEEYFPSRLKYAGLPELVLPFKWSDGGWYSVDDLYDSDCADMTVNDMRKANAAEMYEVYLAVEKYLREVSALGEED